MLSAGADDVDDGDATAGCSTSSSSCPPPQAPPQAPFALPAAPAASISSAGPRASHQGAPLARRAFGPGLRLRPREEQRQ